MLGDRCWRIEITRTKQSTITQHLTPNTHIMTEIDSQFLLLINGFHTDYLDRLMWLISGKLVWIPFYIITLFAIYKKRGWKGALHALLLVGVMMLLTDMLNSQVIRPWFHRLRPTNLENPLSQYVHIVNDYRGGSYSFPSIHAANYWGLSLLVAYFMKSKRVLYSLFLLSLIVCYSRSYLGVHYPGDLLGGIIYSTIVVGAIIWTYQKYLPKASVPEVRKCPILIDWIPAISVLATLMVFVIVAAF